MEIIFNNDRYRILSQRQNLDFDMEQAHLHDEYELYYLFYGERYFIIKDRTWLMPAGSVAILDANQIHRAFSGTHSPHRRFILCVKKANIDPVTEQLCKVFLDGRILRLRSTHQSAFETIINKALDECEKDDKYSHLYINMLAHELLIFINRAVETDNEPPQDYDYRIFKIIQYINEHSSEQLSLGDVAQHFDLSVSHFSKLFKSSTGYAFVEYLNNIRVKNARELLVNENLSITDISSDAGFENVSYFGKVFKSIVGMSPSEYRKGLTRNS